VDPWLRGEPGRKEVLNAEGAEMHRSSKSEVLSINEIARQVGVAHNTELQQLESACSPLDGVPLRNVAPTDK
jgi:hypothetical protein